MGALVGGLYATGLSPWEIDSLFRTELFQIMAEGGIEPEYDYYFKQDAPDASLINLRFDLDTTLQTSLPTNLRSPALFDLEQMRGFAPASAPPATIWTACSCLPLRGLGYHRSTLGHLQEG
jgi:NTE family protein